MNNADAFGINEVKREDLKIKPEPEVEESKVKSFDDLVPKHIVSRSQMTTGGLMRKSVYFDRELWLALDEFAREKGCSVSELIRFCCRHSMSMDLEPAVQPRGGAAS